MQNIEQAGSDEKIQWEEQHLYIIWMVDKLMRWRQRAWTFTNFMTVQSIILIKIPGPMCLPLRQNFQKMYVVLIQREICILYIYIYLSASTETMVLFVNSSAAEGKWKSSWLITIQTDIVNNNGWTQNAGRGEEWAWSHHAQKNQRAWIKLCSPHAFSGKTQ